MWHPCGCGGNVEGIATLFLSNIWSVNLLLTLTFVIFSGSNTFIETFYERIIRIMYIKHFVISRGSIIVTVLVKFETNLNYEIFNVGTYFAEKIRVFNLNICVKSVSSAVFFNRN